jgi:hypothetical protein
MKALPIISLLFIYSCTAGNSQSPSLEAKREADYDRIIREARLTQKKNEQLILLADQQTAKKIDHAAEVIVHLKDEINVLKTVSTVEKIQVRVDTVYIETKKNFWGKEKTNVSLRADSTVTEIVDTLNQNQ